MAMYDEHFYTTIYHGIPPEHQQTIRGNIAMLEEASNYLETGNNMFSFASIFSGPMAKVGSFVSKLVVEDLKEAGEEKLNQKVKVIAKNEESSTLIKTLYEEKHGQTPHIIMLSELAERHQNKIELLSKKYDKQTISNALHNTSGDMSEIQNEIKQLKLWLESSQATKYEETKTQSYYDTFANLSQIGTAFQCNELVEISNMAQSFLTIRDSINLITNAQTVVSMINPITSLLCVGSGLFSMFKKKKSNNQEHIKMLIKYFNILRQELHSIQQELHSIHQEMRENFKMVFRYLDNITEKLQIQYTMTLNIYHKIEQVQKSIENVHVICEYYGKQNLLQDFYRTVYKVIKGTPEYFSSLGLAGFNEIFMDLFFWLENHSFDHGLNGYIYSSTSGNVVNNLNASIHNRIGYLAYLLSFSYNQNMVNPKIFGICIDALTILIHKALPYYGSIPISVEQIIPIMNKANLTEQFINYSRQPQVLEIQISQYNHTVDKLRATLLQWIDSTRYKIGYNIHDMTLEKMVSATPISTGIRYASDPNKFWSNLPMCLASMSGSILQIYKLCEVAIKLGLGNYDFKFSLSHGEPYFNRIPVTINILTDFILEGTRYNINSELWHAPALLKGLKYELTSEYVLGWWQHDYQSQRWTLQDCTQTNTYFEKVLKEACEKKLNSIRQEMSSIQYPIGSQVSTLCDVLQEKYIIINKMFELNDTTLEGLNSGVWIKTRLNQLINHENTYGYNVISFCDFVKEKSLAIKAQYNNPIIKDGIRNSITRLNELTGDINIIQQDYIEISERDKLAQIEHAKVIQEEQKQKEEKQRITQEQEIKNISDIGMQVGRSLTIDAILKKLQSMNKINEADLIQKHFGNETQHQIQIVEEDIKTITLFNTSFSSGSSMALLEISMHLRDYPQTLMDIQKTGYQILQQILTSPVKSIGYTMNKFLIRD